MKQKVAVGLSGGVDSAVSAALLKEQGFEVIGVFMKNWSDDFGLNGECPWEQDQADAKAVADHLGIEFLSYNFELQYRERVIQYFFDEYAKGRTPNPDILCNSEIKFNVFLKKCLSELNVDFIATGHYARTVDLSKNQPTHLLKGLDNNKDQSYFLCRLTDEELSRSIFPVGHLQKSEVRKIAEKLKLPVAKKKDSQGICFVGKINVRKFLESELGMRSGRIIDIDANKDMGEHKGLWFYTIGQREGLGFGGGPWFVVKKDIETNTIFIAKGKDNPALYSSDVNISELQILNYELLITNCDKVEVSLRYRQVPAKAKLSEQSVVARETSTKAIASGKPKNIEIASKTSSLRNDKLVLKFEQPQRAVSPGQFACIYVGEEVVASGVIQETSVSPNIAFK